jgi:hypothetical protein
MHASLQVAYGGLCAIIGVTESWHESKVMVRLASANVHL